MHSSFYMIEKELIEHKMITRVPLFILACGFLIFISLLMNTNIQGNLFYEMQVSGDISDIHQGFASNINLFIASTAGLVSLVLSSLYLPKTLRKERQEGSSMFWRSMPVSHLTTHIVKLVFGLLVIPVICSTLVLAADLSLWVINQVSDQQLSLLINQESVFYVLFNWLGFLARMVVVALALLPLACITLMISQVVGSPVLVMVVGGYALKWLSVYLFGFHGISEFFNAVLSIPLKALSPNPFSGFTEAGIVNLVVYYALGAGGLAVSLMLSKTNEPSLKGLFSGH